MLAKIGKFLLTRFPAKVTVTEESYEQLQTELTMVRSELKDAQLSLNKILERLSVVEQNSVHKEPVKLLIEEMAKIKAEYASLKVSMGFTPNKEIEAMLNGEQI